MHFAGSLEICSRINLFSDIHYFFWGSSTSFPNSMNANNFLWPGKVTRNLRDSINISHKNIKLSSKMTKDQKWVNQELTRLVNAVKDIKFMEELISLDDESLKPSAAISNCLTNMLRQRTINYGEHGPILRKALRSYLEVYSAAKYAVVQGNCDLGIIFNGRFLHERACWDALRSEGISTQIYEVTRDRFFLRPEGFHDRKHNQRYIQEFWEKTIDSPSGQESIAKSYYEKLRFGKNPYIAASEKSDLEYENYFVYFANSDDEAFGFWESWQKPLGSQIDVIRKLQEIFDERKREILIIRLHPNFANKSVEERDLWNSLLDSPFSRVIGFRDKVSSYTLMEKAKGVLTFGSTMGLEAAYWKKPVAVLADCHYDELGTADKLQNWESVIKWIDAKHCISSNVLDQRHIASFKKPWYMAKAGEKFIHCELQEIGHPGWGSWEAKSFKGVYLGRPDFLTKISRLLTKLRLSRLGH
jgi:hypothetical protein